MARLTQTPNVPRARLPLKRDLNFAKRLKRAMAERELSQSDLAARIWGRRITSQGKNDAIGKDRISMWIRGLSFPDRKNLEKLARALKVKIEDLAPEAELKAARRDTADWSVTKPHGANGMTFVQIAQYLPDDIARQIIGLLLGVERVSPKPLKLLRGGKS